MTGLERKWRPLLKRLPSSLAVVVAMDRRLIRLLFSPLGLRSVVQRLVGGDVRPSSSVVEGLCRRRAMSGAEGRRVYVTRRVPCPGVELLREAGCVVTQWDSDRPVPKDEIVRNVASVDALFCLLSDRIDEEVIAAAGHFSMYPSGGNVVHLYSANLQNIKACL